MSNDDSVAEPPGCGRRSGRNPNPNPGRNAVTGTIARAITRARTGPGADRNCAPANPHTLPDGVQTGPRNRTYAMAGSHPNAGTHTGTYPNP